MKGTCLVEISTCAHHGSCAMHLTTASGWLLAQVLTASQGEIDLALLDLPRDPQHMPLVSAVPSSFRGRGRGRSRGRGSSTQRDQQQQHQAAADDTLSADAAGAGEQQRQLPVLKPGVAAAVPGSSSGQYRSCGWLFHSDDVFDHSRLLELLTQLAAAVLRVKGVFRWAVMLSGLPCLWWADITLLVLALALISCVG